MNSEKLIELQGITKLYGTGDAAFLALRGVDLVIRGGEFVAITHRFALQGLVALADGVPALVMLHGVGR